MGMRIPILCREWCGDRSLVVTDSTAPGEACHKKVTQRDSTVTALPPTGNVLLLGSRPAGSDRYAHRTSHGDALTNA